MLPVYQHLDTWYGGDVASEVGIPENLQVVMYRVQQLKPE